MTEGEGQSERRSVEGLDSAASANGRTRTEQTERADEHRAFAIAEYEKALRLHDVLTQIPALVTISRGRDHALDFANPVAEGILGAVDIRGKKPAELLSDPTAREALKDLAYVARTGHVVHAKARRVLIKRPDSTGQEERFFDTTMQPLRRADGSVEAVLSFAYDVTEEVRARRRMEALAQDLETERDLLRAIIEQSADGIIVADERGVLRIFNPAAERQHGISMLELSETDWPRMYMTDGRPEAPRDQPPLTRALRGEYVENARWQVQRPDGSVRTLAGTATPLRRPNGASAGAVLITRDETERTRYENEREAEQRWLEEILDREQDARRQAEQANRLRDEFLATMSHELRTPLSAILGWAQLLKEKKGDPKSLDKGIDTIERNARVLVKLVEDVLDVSRIITGKLALKMRRVELNTVALAAVDVVRPTADAKGVLLVVDLDPDVGRIWADPDRVQQIVWNLLANGVKFTPVGGRVEISIRREAPHATIRVTDTGQGIDPDFLPYIWDRFRQADSSTTRKHGGLGLGLAIVRHIAEALGGSVHAESEGPGLGATFTVRLPLGVTQVDSEIDEGSRPGWGVVPERKVSCDLGGLRVLVVDDDRDAQELVSTVLRDHGADVLAAGSAREALEGLALFKPHVLLSDIGMPDTDGHELVRRIRALPADQGGRVPVIALTAYARAEDRTRALLSGFQMHVSKPIAVPELVSTVASAAGRTTPEADAS
jgi:PAS domain S-box-containing protein